MYTLFTYLIVTTTHPKLVPLTVFAIKLRPLQVSNVEAPSSMHTSQLELNIYTVSIHL